jgi:uncharacterized protein (DUF433 family)
MDIRQIVKIDPQIMSGDACFSGTRVPVQALIDYLAAGRSLDVFLDGYPTVSKEQAVGFLEHARDALIEQAHHVEATTR